MSTLENIINILTTKFTDKINCEINRVCELTVSVNPEHLLALCEFLKTDPSLHFEQLIDLCGVDYLHYGIDEWMTKSATSRGFSRGVRSLTNSDNHYNNSSCNNTSTNNAENHNNYKQNIDSQNEDAVNSGRFAVVYHLLSISNNQRIRLKALTTEDPPRVPSVTNIWNSANWYEREAFDLFGIFFIGHPDLRRILTDYGFIGHPFRKDFPLIGKVEVKYDENLKRVIYAPVSIEPRILAPKVIREK